MILADKIIKLRKKNGWSQEELAEKMNVSRQAVSKWEGAQTVPDLDKILQLAKLFGVTTDYLLKDEMEDEEYTDETVSTVRRVSLAEANAYLAWRRIAALRIAIATFLCILSPVPLILLCGMTELEGVMLPETLAVGVGLPVLLLMVAVAVGIFVHCGFRNEPYAFFEKEPFEAEYGVEGMVKEREKAYHGTYVRTNVIATCLCVLSPIPLLIGAMTQNAFLCTALVGLLLLTVGVAVILFIVSGVKRESMQTLLGKGEFAKKQKEGNKVREAVQTVYWAVALAVYLGWSFLTSDWGITWIVWPIAGVLSSVVTVVCNLLLKDEE